MALCYILLSGKDDEFYIGYTKDLKRRLEKYNTKKNFSTKGKLPLSLIYIEVCLDEEDAKRRENYLKTSQGRRFLKLRLRKLFKKLRS